MKNNIYSKNKIRNLTSSFLIIAFLLSTLALPIQIYAYHLDENGNYYTVAKNDTQNIKKNNREESETNSSISTSTPDKQKQEKPSFPLLVIPILQNIFSPATTTSTSTPITNGNEKETSNIPVIIKVPTQNKSEQSATGTAGVITSNNTLKKAPEGELVKSSQINPLLSFWKKDTSTSDLYAYAGLGGTTTLLLILAALILGAGGVRLMNMQSARNMTSSPLRSRPFSNTIVSNH